MHMFGCRSVGLVILATVFLGRISFVPAAEVEIRLVAADREGAPLVSDLVDYRRAPDGGLIATQWVSGVRLGDDPLFPVVNPDQRQPEIASPGQPSRVSKEIKDGVDDLLADIKTSGAQQTVKPRPVDMVDEIYRGRTLSDGRPIGPIRIRRSRASIDVASPLGLNPGSVPVDPRAGRVDVPCYPVTMTAVTAESPSKSVEFRPTLTWKNRDLLADCLFEHSPDLPRGDVGDAANVDSTLARLEAMQGGKRPFRRLTIYLPATGTGPQAAPYRTGGHAFTVHADGVRLVDAAGRKPASGIRQRDRFHLELVEPVQVDVEGTRASPGLNRIAVLNHLGEGWTAPGSDSLNLPRGREPLTITLQSPGGERFLLNVKLPGDAAEFRHWYIVLAGPGPDHQLPHALVVGVPDAKSTADGRLALRLSRMSPDGPVKISDKIDAELEQWTFALPREGSDDTENRTTAKVEFASSSAGVWTATLPEMEPGMVRMRLSPRLASKAAIPVVIADRETRGSATLATYHNRCDYFRGEQVHAAVITRASSAMDGAEAALWLRQPDGTELQVGNVRIAAKAGEPASQFVTLKTDRLGLGEHELMLKADGVITYPLRFRLFSSTPKTTFALYSWMVGSFSGPVRTGGETLINMLFDQKPTQFLSPNELDRYTGQGTVPEIFTNTLARDALYPAPEKTALYDADTEREMAVAMRLGIRYAPSYGWGMNGQEANWNPKHTLPDDLARMRRLSSQVTQRYRDFGNFAGLHLNWFPTIGGYWENHPATDGHVGVRAERLREETQQIELAGKSGTVLSADDQLELARRRSKYRAGALPRAYEAWTESARRLTTGMQDNDRVDSSAHPSLEQPGLTGPPAYTSFLPVSWFHQHQYHPSVYFAALPAATVHAYTDYGFSPYQPLWAIDYWAAGLRDKPVWVTTMSNGRDIMLRHALLAVGRGADGVDINGQDPAAARVISDFLTAYGPFFRTLEPVSDVAIITSYTQQVAGGKSVGKWMGYTGGAYFDLYTKLWYARRPPAMLPEEDVTLERLASFKAVFLVDQKVRMPEPAMQALRAYAGQGGRIFKTAETSDEFPGKTFQLAADTSNTSRAEWHPDKYRETRDQMFVGTHASYESVARQLDELLAELPPPQVTSDSHRLLVASLAGRDVAAVFAVNDTRTPPGIYHPWNFWSATVLASKENLTFDRPYVIYDVLSGGREIKLEEGQAGRYELPVEFDRCAGRALVATAAPIREIHLQTAAATSGGAVDVAVRVLDDAGRAFSDALPVELSLVDEQGQIVERIYRALGPGVSARLTVPISNEQEWKIRARELLSGRTAEATVQGAAGSPPEVHISPVLVPRPGEVRRFFAAKDSPTPEKPPGRFDPLQAVDLGDSAAEEGQPKYLILLDAHQIDVFGPELESLANGIAAALKPRGIDAELRVVDSLDLVEVPLRWRPTSRDREYLAAARTGERVVVARSLSTRYHQGEKDRNKPDFLHPESGYAEPGARHRIYQNVILLGTPENNRFLADLHESVGMPASENLPAAQSAVVQVIFDAFTPGHHALSVQAADVGGMRRGVDEVLALLEENNSPSPEQTATKDGPLQISQGDRQLPLSNPIEETFGAAVHPIRFTPDGGLLASAGTQAANYFLFDAEGRLKKKWLGKYAVHPSASQQVFWIRDWWGVPGFVDKIVRADANLQPQWMMQAPRYSDSYQFWNHPGTRTLVDPVSDDLFVAGNRLLSRISPDGKVLWQYDDTDTCQDVESFRFSRDIMLHDVSGDGRYLLAALFGIEPYARLVSKFVRPTVMLIDARSGEVLWEKPGVLVDHSACRFDGERIILADASPDKKRVMLLDLAGKERWSQSRPQGTSEARLSPDGQWLVARPEAPRGANHQVLGPAEGLETIHLAEGTTRRFELSDEVAAWRMLTRSGRVLASTADGRLCCFEPDASLLWEQQFPGPSSLLDSPAGDEIAVGTQNGMLLWLNGEGRVLRQVDLMTHNRVSDLEEYVRQYTQAPSGVPVLEPSHQSPSPIHQRAGDVVAFSDNLINGSAAALEEAPLHEHAEVSVKLQAGQTHVMSLDQKSAASDQSESGDRLRIEVKPTSGGAPIYAAELPISMTWQERTLSWKTDEGGMYMVTFSFHPANDSEPKSGVQLRRVGVYQIRLPSPSLLAQRTLDAPRDPLAAQSSSGVDLLGPDGKVTPPTVRFLIPNDVDLTARSRGAPPFTKTIDFTLPFNGRLGDEKTSWLGKPLSGSTHARLELEYKQPVTLGALAVYEDTAGADHYTDTYAIFLRDAKTGRWTKAAHVIGNRSPYNLFTFPAVTTDQVVYLWLKSADGHARVAELEGYAHERSLLP